MAPIFTVDARSGIPLYAQLVEQVKRAVALELLSPGDQLPTVKALALDLTINPNTVARAYRDLERDGIIATSPGRGSFVAPSASPGDAKLAANDVARGALDEAVRTARSFGLARDAVAGIFAASLDRWFPASAEEKS